MNSIYSQTAASGAANGSTYGVLRGEEGRAKRVLYEVTGTCSFFIQGKARASAVWVDLTASLTASGSQTLTLGDDVRVRVASSTTATIVVYVEDVDNAVVTSPVTADEVLWHVEPVATATGNAIAQVAVALVKSGVIVPREGILVTISKQSGATCVLSGNLTAYTEANGIARFPNVRVTATPIEAVTLLATVTGYTTDISASFNVTA